MIILIYSKPVSRQKVKYRGVKPDRSLLKTRNSNQLPAPPVKLTGARVENLLDRFGKCHILIIGDIMLDRYLWGNVSRISPEAPVPVVEINQEEHLLGGAANVAKNIAALTGKPNLVGVVGKDNFGSTLKAKLKADKFSIAGIFADQSRPTTVKTRIIAHNQQVVRADREKTDEISAGMNKKIAEYIDKCLPGVSGVIISDYGKGVINKNLLEYLITACNERNIFIAVDPKESHFYNYRHVSTITPNHHEAGFVAGKKIKDDETLKEVGWRLLDQLQSRSVLITLGAKGMALFEESSAAGKRSLTMIPALARKVFDVTGAGDTVIAALTLAVAAGASLKEAAFIANVAASEVVGEVGTAQVKKDRLKKLLMKFL
jgi:rfaE bifunctional protein kinase chain/domain